MTTAGVDRPGRIARARHAMAHTGVEMLLLSVGSDLPYFVDYRAIASERLTMVAIPAEGPVTLLVPELEAPRVEIDPELGAVVAWGDHQRPIEMVRDLLTGVTTAAIGDHTWSRFLLAIQEACPGVRFVPASGITAPLRLVKDDTEIELLGVAADAADRVMVRLAEEHFAGRTERDLARFLATALIEEGHEVAEFAIVASGSNAASPHHEATDRVVGPGDTVVADFGGSIGGYFSDTTRTFSVGEPSAEVAAAHEALETAQQAGFEAVRPGATAEAVDDATRRVLADAGFAEWFIHRTGHGIGLEVHEEPYLVAGNAQPLHPGMVFSVEPGIYVPGRFGMRIEDIVVVTEDGGRRLNRSPRRLGVVG